MRLLQSGYPDGIFKTIKDARTEIFEYLEIYYNTISLHSSLNYQSPIQFENLYEKQCTFEMHQQTAMLYTEESFNERGYIVTYDNKYRRTKEAEEYEK
ncbi:MAG: IS3 family transposase [Sediminibacterium sp.]|nr:IS3 family transposase [Sediminibacterium sp.]